MADLTKEMFSKTILQNEGEAFTNYANDLPTKYGVVPSDIQECVDDGLLPKSCLEDAVQYIKNLDVNNALTIHKHQYFDKLSLSRIIYQDIAAKLFDMALPMGRKAVVKCAQRTVRSVSQGATVLEEDGVMGKDTINAINGCFHSTFLASFRSECAAYYRMTSISHPEKKEYLRGWLNRAYQ